MAIPVYRRVSFDLKQKILSGHYLPGTLLPTEGQLQEIYQVSRTTVRRAMQQLAEQNYVRVKQGYGTVVTDKHKPMGFHRFHNITEITEILLPDYDSAKPTTSLFKVDECPADETVARELCIQPGEGVYRIQRVFDICDKSFAYMTNYVRTDVAPGLVRFDGERFDLYTLLSEQYGIVFKEGYEMISACVADDNDAEHLNIPAGAPLIRMTRMASHEKGPMEYVVTKILPEVYAIRIDMEGPPKYRR